MLLVNGHFAATTKSFLIDHPSKTGMKLQYASLEGPENGVYVRGRATGDIALPDYWTELVDESSVTVQLTPIGAFQNIYVSDITNNCVYLSSDSVNINCFYLVQAERKDVKKLTVEF
jgi:hypothetical protein